jgi:hypothetical protein
MRKTWCGYCIRHLAEISPVNPQPTFGIHAFGAKEKAADSTSAAILDKNRGYGNVTKVI